MRRLLLALFAAFNPRLWMRMAHSFRSSEGWGPPMMLIAVFGVVGFGGGFVRGSIIATLGLCAWAVCWAIVFSISSSLAFTDSLRNIGRFGFSGYKRSRLWFEIARSSCILGVMCALPAFLVGFVALPIFSFIYGILIIPCFAVFCFASTVGYSIAVLTRQRVTGRAKECVHFFYPMCLGGLAIVVLFFMFRPELQDPWSYGPPLLTLIMACLFGALALTGVDRYKRGLPPKIGNAL